MPLSLGHSHRSVARDRRSGFTFLELIITLFVLSVALMAFASSVGAVSKQRMLNRENALAREAARTAAEIIRSEDFGGVFARYNTDPGDDPGGPATAPGSRFEAAGLEPLTEAADGLHGDVEFPTVETALGLVHLREDVDDRGLGMPRDLNGDGVLDTADHSGDYFILPVRIRVRWQGLAGPRVLETTTMLCEYNKQ